MSNVDNLISFGFGFQSKVIAALLTDIKFLEQSFDILQVDYFESIANQWIVTIIRDYYEKYKKEPTLDVFKVALADVKDDIKKTTIIESLRAVTNQYNATDLNYVKEKFLDFGRNQELKKAILKSVEFIERGEYDAVKHEIDRAYKAGTSREIGMVYKETLERRISDTMRNVVETPWPVITEIMGGGLGKGELGVVVAPPGVGKCVGKDTEIEIEYEEYGLEIGKTTLWFKPWEKVKVDDVEMFVWQAFKTIEEANFWITIINKKKVIQKIKIGDLFEKLEIENKENSNLVPEFHLQIKTPYGFKPIKTLFRTEKQPTVRLYFSNGKTLETGFDHQLKANGDWKKVKNITENDIIETELGVTTLKRKHFGKEKILYDLSVKNVHCYYSNNILSHNSWFLVMIGAHAVANNKKVLHYTLELSEEYIGLRYDAYYTGFATSEIKYHKDEVQHKIDLLKGNVIIKGYSTKTASINTIVAHMQRAMTLDFHPDLVIVDYADLLKGYMYRGEAKKRFELENIYEELRGTAGEFQLPIWTASQSNRSSYEEDIIGANMVAEAFSKVMIADFVMSLSRKTTDKIMNTGRVHIIKNRFGPDGLTFPSSMNASNGNVQIFPERSEDGTKTTLKMKKGEDITKQQIKKAFDEILVKSKLKPVDMG